MDEKLVKNNNKKLSQYKKTKKTTSLGVEQIDLVTGKCLNTFKNRYQAASWIVENKLTDYFYLNLGATRAAIAGALTIAMIKYGTAYGFKWKFTDSKPNKIYFRLPNNTKSNKNNIVSIYDHNFKRTDFPSIKDACISIGITSRFRSDKLVSTVKKLGYKIHIKK